MIWPLIAVIAVAAAVWLARLAVLPYGACRCARSGRRGRGTGSASRAWSHCRKCGGSGERIRRGARTIRRAIGRPLPEEN